MEETAIHYFIPAFRIRYFFTDPDPDLDPTQKPKADPDPDPGRILTKNQSFEISFFGKKNFVNFLCLSKNALNTQILEHLNSLEFVKVLHEFVTLALDPLFLNGSGSEKK